MVFILGIKKVRLTNYFTQGHITNKWWIRELNQGLSHSEAHVCGVTWDTLGKVHPNQEPQIPPLETNLLGILKALEGYWGERIKHTQKEYSNMWC